MIVADTNLIAYLLIPSNHTADAESILRKDSAWSAPLLWRSEFRNVLASYLRSGQMRLEDAVVLMTEAEGLLEGGEYEVPSAPVLTLSEQSGCSAYDCEFVHLAQELGVPLVTSDRTVLRAFPAFAVAMDVFIR
ncbi:MAG: type II toxin-antitoxin system VapC family toxin [Gemmatimonadota bacterium]